MDWKLVIGDLEDSGLTQREIAEKAGCSQPYVSQLKSGARKKPKFDVGRALVDLHSTIKPRRNRKSGEVRAA